MEEQEQIEEVGSLQYPLLSSPPFSSPYSPPSSHSLSPSPSPSSLSSFSPSPASIEHECNYKLLYMHLLDELAIARREVELRDNIINEMYSKIPEKARANLELPNTFVISQLSRTPSSSSLPKSSSLKSFSTSKYSSSSSSSSSSLSKPLSPFGSSKNIPPKPLTSKPLPPSSSPILALSSKTSFGSSSLNRRKSQTSLPPLDSTNYTSFTFDTLPDNSRYTSFKNSKSPNRQSTTTTTTTSTSSTSQTTSKPLPPSKSGNKTTSMKPASAKTTTSKIAITSKPKSNLLNTVISSMKKPAASAYSGNSGVPFTTGRLQVENDETYARILQDIEEKKARERIRGTTSMRRNNNASFASFHPSPAPENEISNYQYFDLLGEESYRSSEWSPTPSVGDEIGTSYEELSQLEDVCTGIPENIIDTIITKQPVTSELESTKCTICLDEYNVGEEYTTLHCSHTFHYFCIFKCLSVKKTCPLCKVYVI